MRTTEAGAPPDRTSAAENRRDTTLRIPRGSADARTAKIGWQPGQQEGLLQIHGPNQHGDPYENSIDGERRETAAAHPVHKPRDDAISHHKRDNKPDCQQHPAVLVDVRGPDRI